MRFSVWPRAGQPWPDVLEVARHAEATGWDGLYAADHFMGDGEQAGGPVTAMLEATAVLAGLAQATERLRLGSLVFGITYRHPAVLAKWAATVDHVSGGRLLLGVGAGWQENEHEQYGIELGTLGERIDRLVEALDVLTGLLRTPATTVHGASLPRHRRRRRAEAGPGPPAAADRRPRATACSVSSPATPTSGTCGGCPTTSSNGLSLLAARCADIGRDPASIAHSCQALWFFHDDQAKADALVERVAPRPAIGGSLDRLTDVVGGWADAGVGEVIIPDFTLGAGRERLDRLDRIIEGIAPAFR